MAELFGGSDLANLNRGNPAVGVVGRRFRTGIDRAHKNSFARQSAEPSRADGLFRGGASDRCEYLWPQERKSFSESPRLLSRCSMPQVNGLELYVFDSPDIRVVRILSS